MWSSGYPEKVRVRREERDVVVRWGMEAAGISALLDLNGVPRWIAFEERFVVAEEDGEVVAALRCRTGSGRLALGLLVADPWRGERRPAGGMIAVA